jgi:tetratricopeptide (TPR) repeat protein
MGRSSGAAATLLHTSIRVIALEAAADAYRGKRTADVRRYLTIARSANARVGAEEVAHDLAVVDLLEGKVDAAIAQLERSRLPDALVNLGIAYEKKGEPQKALDAWRRARKAGVKWKDLDDWIQVKERVYGGEP